MTLLTGFRKRTNNTNAIAVASALAIGSALALSTSTLGQEMPTMTSQTIADAVEDEFLFDRAVPAHEIDVTVRDGVAKLTGTVDNVLAKERAARIARVIKGVERVDNRIKVVSSWSRTDQAIRHDIRDALLTNPATDSYEIDAKVVDNVATLTGTVESYQERNLAAKVAKGVRGVEALKNDIDVDYDVQRPDYELVAEVEEVLRWDTLVDDGLIDVNVENGVAVLSGTVGSAAEKHRAHLDAYVPGVTAVKVEELDVERWARDDVFRRDKYVDLTDAEIKGAIERSLHFDPEILSSNVETTVNEGEVTLRGAVQTLTARRTATRIARQTVGVEDVANRLKVRSDEDRDPQAMINDFQKAVTRDPYIEQYEISATVSNHTMDLRGVVDHPFEKRRAEDLAASIPGVKNIENHITVDTTLLHGGRWTYDPYVDGYGPEIYLWFNPVIPYAWKVDERIQEDINDQLWWSPFVDANDVTVTVNDGKAHLTGVVDSWSEYDAATENAWEGGARYVHNDLVVQDGE